MLIGGREVDVLLCWWTLISALARPFSVFGIQGHELFCLAPFVDAWRRNYLPSLILIPNINCYPSSVFRQ